MQLSQIRFADPAGLAAGTYGATQLASGEVVPNGIPFVELKYGTIVQIR